MLHQPLPAATRFVERDIELETLTAMLDQALQGRGGLALVAGEAGIGKTRLIEELASSAHARGIPVLWGRCREGEGAPAFWPWLQILRGLLRDQTAAAFQAGLDPAAVDFASLLPALHGEPPGVPDPALADPAQARFRLFEGITALFRTLSVPSLQRASKDELAEPDPTPSERGLLLVFDDLHWADEASLLVLRHLAPHLAQMSLMVAATYRDTELARDHPLSALLGAIAGRHQVISVPLRGLSDAAVARLIDDAGVASHPEAVLTFIRRGEGNPLFVRELLSLLAMPGAPDATALRLPATLRGLVDRRLRGASTACHDLLTTAAVIGRELTLPVLAAVAGVDRASLATLLEEAERLGVLTHVPGTLDRYRFSHELMRDALYEELPTLRRARLHLRTAEALAKRAETDQALSPAELAYHFLQAAAVGGAERAVAFARAAGDQALAQLAYEEAGRQYALALQTLDLTPGPDAVSRCELLLSLGDARLRAGDQDAGQTTLWAAVDAARAVGLEGDAGRLLARTALRIGGFVLSIHPRMERLVALLEEALASLGPEDTRLRAQILGRLAMELHSEREEERRDALSSEAVAIARRTGDPRTIATALLVRHNAMRGPDATRLLPLATEAQALADAAGDLPLALWISRVRANDLADVGDFAAFDQARRAHGRLAEQLRDPYHRWQHALWQAMQAALAGRFQEAVELADRALALGSAVAGEHAELCHAVQIAAISLETGAYADGLAAFRPMPARFPALDGLPALLAVLQLAGGDRDGARMTFERLVTGGAHSGAGTLDFDGLRRGGMWLMAVALLARAAVELGDVPRMRRLYDLLLPYVHLAVMIHPAVVCLGAVSYHLGRLAGALLRAGGPDALASSGGSSPAITAADAERHLLDALRFHERIDAPALATRTRVDYASLLLDHSRRQNRALVSDGTGALTLLEQATATARQLGMNPLVRAIEELGGRGLPLVPAVEPAPRAAGGPIPGGLTGREVEVLLLLAAGATNKQIGATLYLSPNTVRQHTISIYRKSGATGRAEATAWAARHGLL